MDYVSQKIKNFFLVSIFVSSTPFCAAQSQPLSFSQKMAYSCAASTLTFGSFGLLGWGANKLAQYAPLLGKNSSYAAVRPYVIGAGIACMAYYGAHTLNHIVYAKLSGTVQELKQSKLNLEHNEKAIKEVLKEINYVKEHIVGNTFNDTEKKKILNQEQQYVHMTSVSLSDETKNIVMCDDTFNKALPTLLGTFDSYKILEEKKETKEPQSLKDYDIKKDSIVKIFQQTQKLLPPNMSGYAHWMGLLKPLYAVKKIIKYPFEKIRQGYRSYALDFIKDDKLLITENGEQVQEAIKQLLETVTAMELHQSLSTQESAKKAFREFADSAKVIIQAAEYSLSSIKTKKHAIERILEVVEWTKKVSL